MDPAFFRETCFHPRSCFRRARNKKIRVLRIILRKMRCKKELFCKRSSHSKASEKSRNKIFRILQNVLQARNIDVLNQESFPKQGKFRQDLRDTLCLTATIIENQIYLNRRPLSSTLLNQRNYRKELEARRAQDQPAFGSDSRGNRGGIRRINHGNSYRQ